MKTIEERAKEYVKRVYDGNYTDVELGFIRGAQSEHKELTGWNSPDNIPDTNRWVLIKIKMDEYAVGYYNHYDDSWHIPSFFESDGLYGWREIFE